MAATAVAPLHSLAYRYLVALVLASLVTMGGVGAGYLYINAKWSQARTVELNLAGGPAANFLILGSDSREFVATEQDVESFGTVGGTRADTIILVRVDPRTRKAVLVSFPRDLWVEIPGRGFSKINAAFSQGPQGVIDTLRHNFDVAVHHYVEVDFAGLRNLVNAMGGVRVFFAAPARDGKTGLQVPEPGCVTLDGDQALALVRSRQYQFFESGRWRSDPTGDFGRIQRQQDFIRRLIAQAIESAATNPFRGDRLVDRALENILVDSGLGVGDVLKLVRVFRSGNPEDVEMVTIPSTVGARGGQSVVLLKDEEAAPIFERLRGEGVIDGEVAPSDVTVRVLNGVGTAGLAGQTAQDLQAAGFQPGGIGDADRFGYDRTVIQHRPDTRAAAELLRDYLGGVAELAEVDGLGNVDVVLVLGEDFGGVVGPEGESLGPADREIEPIAHVRAQEEPAEPAGAEAVTC